MSLKQQLQIAKRCANGQAMPKARNLSARSPLLKKGGIHDQDNPNTAHRRKRRAVKLSLQKGAWGD